jgi:predicted transcriptional regulator
MHTPDKRPPAPPPKTFSFHADPDLARALSERAGREDRTVSSLIRVALRRYLRADRPEVTQ